MAALQHDDLGLARHTRQPLPRGVETRVHRATGQIRVFRVMHDKGPEILRIGEDAAHDLGVAHRLVAVGEGHGAGFLEQADLGHVLTGEPLGQGRHRPDIDDGRVAGAAQDEVHQRRIVDHRIGLGQGDDGGDAASRRRLAGAGKGFAVFVAGFANGHAHVDQAGSDDSAIAVAHLGAIRRALVQRFGTGSEDRAIGNDDRARRIDATGRVDHPCVGQDQGFRRVSGHGSSS
jgi:hypothetical protein